MHTQTGGSSPTTIERQTTWSEATQVGRFQFYYGSFCECKIGSSIRCRLPSEIPLQSVPSLAKLRLFAVLFVWTAAAAAGRTTLWQFIVCVFLIKRMDKLVRVCNLLFINEVQVPNGFVLVWK